MNRKLIIFSVLVLCFIKYGRAQVSNPSGMDVSIHGYIFFTENGVFFQPLDFFQPNPNFVSSLNKLSFQIFEGKDMPIYSDALRGLGNKLIVRNYFDDTIKKNPNLKVFDTIRYFSCNIYISMDFFDTTYTSFYEYGHGFVFKNKWISYGSLAIRNWLIQIVPDDLVILSKFRNFYIKRNVVPPQWLEKLYKEKVLKRKP